MITRNEYLEALDILKEQHSYLASNMHYNYPFSIWKLQTIQKCFENLIKEHFEPQPYKFEDLKKIVGKPIYDKKYKEFYILAEVKEEEIYINEGVEKFMICSDKDGLLRVFYEENRFYPVQMANVWCE